MSLDKATDVYWSPRRVVGQVAWLVDDLGRGDVQMFRRVQRGRGLDIEPIARLVRDVDGAELTPLPSTDLWSEVVVLERAPSFRRLSCPLWTEAGQSSLEIVVWLEPSSLGHGLIDAYIEQLRERRGGVLLEVAPDQRKLDPDWTEERWVDPVGHGGDSRIRRASFVGASPGILMGQLRRGMDRALGDAQLQRERLNPRQRAVLVLDDSFARLYGEGLRGLYGTSVGDMAPELPFAARQVGAGPIADIFERANALFPSEMFLPDSARDSYVDEHLGEGSEGGARLDAMEKELYSLEDGCESIWPYILRFIDEHPEDFFYDA